MTKRGVIIPFNREFLGDRSAALMVSDLLRAFIPPDWYELSTCSDYFAPWSRDQVWVKVRVVDRDVPWLPVVGEGCEYPSRRLEELAADIVRDRVNA